MITADYVATLCAARLLGSDDRVSPAWRDSTLAKDPTPPASEPWVSHLGEDESQSSRGDVQDKLSKLFLQQPEPNKQLGQSPWPTGGEESTARADYCIFWWINKVDGWTKGMLRHEWVEWCDRRINRMLKWKDKQMDGWRAWREYYNGLSVMIDWAGFIRAQNVLFLSQGGNVD